MQSSGAKSNLGAQGKPGPKPKIIFFGNGPLSEYALNALLEGGYEVVFHAHNKADLPEAVRLKNESPSLVGILASFGALIPSSVLKIFEPEGILNIHPSLLPLYRGASPIESAIIDGCSDFGVSVMKLAREMDAGPIYEQATLENVPNETLDKDFLYKTLAKMGAAMVISNLKQRAKTGKWPTPVPQDNTKATYCSKFTRKDGILDPSSETAEQIYRKIVAFQGFPKAKYVFYGKNCAILEAHIADEDEMALLPLKCADGSVVAVDKLQPDGKKPMDAKSFLNGYGR
ncbi:MAG: formyltransferase family protein [Candidatus Saccharibacteria bacterium]|nr:formyltransferase family protein [Candidatus Saccharibacteria bacterium]